MRCAYFDCFSGAAGDMLLGALLDAGAPPTVLDDVVRGLALPGVSVRTERVRRGGFAATQVHVEIGPEASLAHRHLSQVLQLIVAAGLPQPVADAAERVFRRLAEAEATVHGTAIEKIHFHEVGAADALVDIVGTCALLHALNVQRVICSPIPTGSGTVKCAHGILPVPAPATALLLRGAPLAACDELGELTTPTGAALLTTFAESYGVLPAMRLESVGCGAGTREGRTQPNILRVLLGTLAPDAATVEADVVTVLETQLDDAPGQAVAYALERALAAGALDAFAVPIVMKKGRPGQLLTVLCRPADVAALETLLFAETTTFGIRRYECRRSVLARTHVTVATAYGDIRVKVGRRGAQVVQAWPEYEDCAAAAQRDGVALRTVQAAALEEYGRTANEE